MKKTASLLNIELGNGARNEAGSTTSTDHCNSQSFTEPVVENMNAAGDTLR